MQSEKRHTAGSIRVSEEVIIKIAETAAGEIDGAVLKRRGGSPFRGPVKVRVSGDSAAVKMAICVKEGCNAVSVAEDVQKSVKSAVQNMTGFTVTKVDVEIAGVKFAAEGGNAGSSENVN